ncbi:MAG: hypothetical protein EG823_06915 [Actinobacteria bacterium]|nr:hypothetical protein [Actinomycetota bacterium]
MTDRSIEKITDYAGRKRKHDRVRKLALLLGLVVLLMLLLWTTMYYSANRRLPFPPVKSLTEGTTEAPEFLYAISGPEGADALMMPVGVAVTGDGKVFVVDAQSRVVRAYTTDGDYLFTFSSVVSDTGDKLKLPQRVVIGPDGNVWVTDRHLHGIFVFSPEDGSFIREFIPNSDVIEYWAPCALAFDEDGNLWVADLGLSEQHQILEFDAEGNELLRFGKTVQAAKMTDSPGGFYYPNGIAFSAEGDVFISDMSNHRVQVFSHDGEFKYLVYTSGSPLGLVVDREQRLLVADPFAHMIDVYDLTGERKTGFGGPGVQPGRFRFPSDIALDETGRMFVSDRENNQVQVWGWPTGIIPPVALPEEPAEWGICLSPLLLLLLPLLRRRTSFMTTEDFIEGMIAAGAVSRMDNRKFKWIVTQDLFDRYLHRRSGEVRFGELLVGEPFSRTDVGEFVEQSGADEKTAIILTMAERTGRLATEDATLAEAARALDIVVVDRERFIREFAVRRKGSAAQRRSPESRIDTPDDTE